MRRLLFWVFLFLIPVILSAQREQYIFSHLDVSGGLSHNQVNTIFKDETGFVWFGTMSGLNRFDGYSVKVFRNNTRDTASLTDNYISSIWECPGNRLWIVTRNGVCTYLPGEERFQRNTTAYLQSLSLPAGNVTGIFKDKRGNYWFLYANRGVFRYGTDGNVISLSARSGDGASLSSNSVASVREDSRGNIWLIHRSGVLEKLDSRSLKVVDRHAALPLLQNIDFTYNIFIDREDELWLWSKELGVYSFQPGTRRTIRFHTAGGPYRLNSDLVGGVTQDEHGLIWVGTDHGGVNLINKKDLSVTYLLNEPGLAKSLSQNSIYTLYRDNTGIIWIGTYKQGVSYMNENIVKFPHFSRHASDPKTLPYNDINHFVEDRDGNIWIGTNGGGLVFFDRKQNRFRQYLHNPSDPNSLSSNVIVSLCLDGEGKLWVGTYYGGLNLFDGKRFVHFRHSDADPNSLSNNNVWEIFEDRQQTLWVGTLGGGLDRYDRATGSFSHFSFREGDLSSVQSNYISSLLEDREGNLWIGTANGIDVLNKDRNQFSHYGAGSEISISNNNVIALLEDARGRIWIGTREGLTVYDPAGRKTESFSTDQGLPSNTVLTLAEDAKGTIWLTTPNGLCNLVLKEGEKGAAALTIRNYDELNNLQSREFNENAILRTKSGQLLVGGPNGFNLIDPALIRNRELAPPLVFTGFQLFNKEVAVGANVKNRVILESSITQANEIALRFNENIFSIEFAALDFAHGARDKYAYMLEGFNNTWLFTDGTERKVTYTNLDPGTYYFRVKKSLANGAWSGEKVLKIVIRPPFWKTPLAFVIYIIALGGILLLARRFIIERTEMRIEVEQQRKEAERAHALDRMKTKFFTNVSHEFRTPLSLILSPLDKIIRHTPDADQKKQLQLVQRNAKRLLNLINQLLDFRKMEVQEFRLHPVLGDIVHFTNDICQSFSDISENKNIALSFQSEMPSLQIYFDKDKLEKILFNLLSNAFKYTHDDGRVSVTLRYLPDSGNTATVEIRVSDTGIGIPADKQEKIFERFFQNDVPDNIVNQGSGIGLVITKEFVKLHNGTITVESAPEQGTTFIVTLPVQAPSEEEAGVPVPALQPEAIPEKRGKKEGGRIRVLLVEDNEDFRFYLKDNLKVKYEVIEAGNGKEGWEKVRSVQPDLVVSDVMMPYLNGIELSRRIKGDPRTSHIPVILLTAMGNEETQMEGYKIGVNDYITKPFTFEILASRIKNLIAQQKQLVKKQAEINPTAVTVNPVDEQFLRQALESVEKNIGNADFTVEELSRDLFMSRVALYKKLLSLTGKTPIEFIRTVRLKRGAQLLEKSGLTIAEVAYEVGFNNPKNFTRYFKEEFNVLPSQYAGTEKKEAKES